MAAKSKSRCGSTRTTLKDEDEDDEGDSEDEGQDFVALVPFLFPVPYSLLPTPYYRLPATGY